MGVVTRTEIRVMLKPFLETAEPNRGGGDGVLP